MLLFGDAMKLVPVEDIADYILFSTSLFEDDHISNLKLQKLLYYCQGFHLAAYAAPQCNEDILAWENGPVVESIWRKYREHKKDAINTTYITMPTSLSETQEKLIDSVYSAYGQYSGWKLRNMTHKEPPWVDTPKDGVIAHNKLKSYFRTRLKK